VLKRSRALISIKRKVTGTAVYGTVCTVVWEDGGCEPSSYPINDLPGMTISGGNNVILTLTLKWTTFTITYGS